MRQPVYIYGECPGGILYRKDWDVRINKNKMDNILLEI